MLNATTTQESVAVGQNCMGNGVLTGVQNTGIGGAVMYPTTTGTLNFGGGFTALRFNTTGSYNVAVGAAALYSNTTASNNTALGYQAGYSKTTGNYCTFLGSVAGYSVTTGTDNTFVGQGAGYYVTTGSKNVVLGSYTGSAAPISATGSNYIVLSDGDGNVRQTIDSSGNVGIGTTSPATYGKLAVYTATAAQNIIQANTDSGSYTGVVCSLTTSTTSTNQYQFLNCTRTGVQEKLVIRDTGNVQNVNNSYGALSDIKLKENIELAGSQWNDVKALSLVIKKFNLKADEDKIKQIGWIAQDVQLISPGLVNAQTDRDLTTGELLDTTSLSVSYSVAQMKAFKALGEALIKIEELTARITALEST
jgi:hypothetical protein